MPIVLPGKRIDVPWSLIRLVMTSERSQLKRMSRNPAATLVLLQRRPNPGPPRAPQSEFLKKICGCLTAAYIYRIISLGGCVRYVA
eukprot:jgi/Botrbrau1/18114/Bobra.0408s0002.1